MEPAARVDNDFSVISYIFLTVCSKSADGKGISSLCVDAVLPVRLGSLPMTRVRNDIRRGSVELIPSLITHMGEDNDLHYL